MSQTKAQILSPVGILTVSGVSASGIVTATAFVGNGSGQLGQNTTTQFSSPVQIPGTGWSSITDGADSQHSLALKGLLN